MVYHGVPSRGCYLCRSRKIKCDETKPFCNRCQKSRRECPGYPVLPSDSARVRGEAKKLARKGSMQSNDDSKGGFSIGYAADWLQVPPSRPDGSESPPLDSTLKVSISDAASCHFLSNFVLVAAEGTNRGFYEFLLPLAESAPAGGAFALAFKACSMASFSYREGLDPVLEQQAATYYSNALAATGAALSRPSIAASDSVLGTVLLLALFELQSGTAEGTTGWGSHIGGSIQLINSRSWKKLNTKAGMSLFVAVRTQLILLAMISGHSIPLSKDWWGKNTFEDKYALHCLQSTMKMTYLRDELKRIIGVQEATVEDFYQLKQLLQKCQALDEAFAQWPDNLPGYFHFKVAATVTEISTNITEADAFPGPVHVYRDPWVACVWNMMRCSRIELNNLVVRCLALIHMDSDYTMLPEYAAVVQNSSEVLADSIASMPYQLGWFKTRQHLLLGEASFACGKNDSQNGLGACVAMWPLVMIQRQDFASDAQRFWANGRLQYIASRLGLRKAAFFGKLIDRQPSRLMQADAASPTAERWRQLEHMQRHASPEEGESAYTLQGSPAPINEHTAPQHVGMNPEHVTPPQQHWTPLAHR